jgi:hypothetical protein
VSYEFLSEYDAMDYIDTMYNDGAEYGTLIEDHRYGVYAETEGERKEGAFQRAELIANELGETWNEIEMLPEVERA